MAADSHNCVHVVCHLVIFVGFIDALLQTNADRAVKPAGVLQVGTNLDQLPRNLTIGMYTKFYEMQAPMNESSRSAYVVSGSGCREMHRSNARHFISLIKCRVLAGTVSTPWLSAMSRKAGWVDKVDTGGDQIPCEICTVATHDPHVTTFHRIDVTLWTQTIVLFLLLMSMHGRISVMFMLRPALPASFLAKIGAAGYTASAARWAMSLALRDGPAPERTGHARLCTLPSTGILALPFFLLHLLVCTSVRHEPELEIGSVHADAGYAKSV